MFEKGQYIIYGIRGVCEVMDIKVIDRPGGPKGKLYYELRPYYPVSYTHLKDKNDINLDDVTMNYYLITYDGETQKYLECTVTGLKEGTHYPIVRPETVEREKNAGGLYDTLDRCYVCLLYTSWHCGMAACTLARKDTGARVGVHPNRKIGPVMDFGCQACDLSLIHI